MDGGGLAILQYYVGFNNFETLHTAFGFRFGYDQAKVLSVDYYLTIAERRAL